MKGFYESQQAPPEGTKIPSNINGDANQHAWLMGCWDCNKWEKSPREEIQYCWDQLEYECKWQNMNLRYPWSMYSLSNHITPVLKSATKTMNALYS